MRDPGGDGDPLMAECLVLFWRRAWSCRAACTTFASAAKASSLLHLEEGPFHDLGLEFLEGRIDGHFADQERAGTFWRPT